MTMPLSDSVVLFLFIFDLGSRSELIDPLISQWPIKIERFSHFAVAITDGALRPDCDQIATALRPDAGAFIYAASERSAASEYTPMHKSTPAERNAQSLTS